MNCSTGLQKNSKNSPTASRSAPLNSAGLHSARFRLFQKARRLKAYPLGLVSGREHISALSGALAKFGGGAREAIDTAGKTGDADTADLFTEISCGVDKLLWMIEAHLQAQD